jgi:hypothetical protein
MSRNDFYNEHIDPGGNLLIQAALGATRPEPQGPCIPAEEFVSFIDGQVEGERRQAILAHLDACNDCYADWLEASALIERSRAKGQVVPGPSRWWQRFTTGQVISISGGLITALAASLVLVISQVEMSSVAKRVPSSYGTFMAARSGKPMSSQLDSFVLPWERSTSPYTFNGSAQPPPSEAAQAFGAGLWVGRNRLADHCKEWPLPAFLSKPGQPPESVAQTWTKGNWADYYWLGQWTMLLQGAIHSETRPDPPFWQEQNRLCQEMTDSFRKRQGKEIEVAKILPILEEMRPIFEVMTKGVDPSKYARQLIPLTSKLLTSIPLQ